MALTNHIWVLLYRSQFWLKLRVQLDFSLSHTHTQTFQEDIEASHPLLHVDVVSEVGVEEVVNPVQDDVTGQLKVVVKEVTELLPVQLGFVAISFLKSKKSIFRFP